MPSSGTFAWEPTVEEIIDESAERARIDPAALTVAQQFSARRSMNAILQYWTTKRPKLRFIDTLSLTLVTGTATYSLPANVLDIIYATHRRLGIDIPMRPLDRESYFNIPDKAIKGRSDRYWVERKTPPLVSLWPVPENSTDTIRYSALSRTEDIKFDMTQTPDVAYLWHEALFDELAARMYQKWGISAGADRNGNRVERFDRGWLKDLRDVAALSYQTAAEEDRERAPTVFTARYDRRRTLY